MPASWWEQLKAMMPDYSGVAQAMPENIGQEKIVDPLANAAVSLATLPKRALGASAEAVTSGVYNPAPAVETAMSMFGGPAAKAGETVLSAGKRTLPPVVSILHGTGSPENFTKLKLPPVEHDIGIHATIDPPATDLYWPPKGNPGEVDWWSGKRFGDPGTAGSRTIPYLGDFRSSLKFPGDAVKWNNPTNVIDTLEGHMRGGFAAPRGLLSDFQNIAGSEQMWQNQFVPMLKDRGYDSLWYPHQNELINKSRYNTFMGFDEHQFTPKWSEEGRRLAEERGVVQHMPRSTEARWRMPQGIIKNPSEVESLVKDLDPKKNTFKWWGEDAPPSGIKQIDQEFMDMEAKLKQQAITGAQGPAGLAKLKEDWAAKKIDDETFWKEYDKLWGFAPGPAPAPIPPPKKAQGMLGGKTVEEMASELELELKKLSKTKFKSIFGEEKPKGKFKLKDEWVDDIPY